MNKFNNVAPKPLSGGGIINEHLSRILKQYELSAMNSLRGPSSLSMQSSLPANNLASSFRYPVSTQSFDQLSPIKKTALTVDRSQDELLNVLTAMSAAASLNRVNRSNSLASQPLPPPHPVVPVAGGAGGRFGMAQRLETLLENEWISCFDVGGEKRLCLPQILNLVLRDYSLPEINDACSDLHIHCSQCTKQQLDVLKLSAILPMNAVNCGLITKTDAERLTNYLVQSRVCPKSTNYNNYSKKVPIVVKAGSSLRKSSTMNNVFSLKNVAALKHKSVDDISTVIRNGNFNVNKNVNANNNNSMNNMMNECSSSMLSSCSSASTSSLLSPTSSVSTRSAFSSPPAANMDDLDVGDSKNCANVICGSTVAVMNVTVKNESSSSSMASFMDDNNKTSGNEKIYNDNKPVIKKDHRGGESDVEDEHSTVVNEEDRFDDKSVEVDDDNLPVYHACFGRCKGKFVKKLYVTPSSECVQCDECGIRMAPYRFVLHSHRNHETRTCHWGFDSANWRSYLHLSPDAEYCKEAEKILDEVKARFVNTSTVNGHKRSMSLDAQNQNLLPSTEKRTRYDNDAVSAVMASAAAAQQQHQQQQHVATTATPIRPNVGGLSGPTTAPNLPLLMYDQLLIYQALLAAHLGTAANLYGGAGVATGGNQSAFPPAVATAASLLPLVAPHILKQAPAGAGSFASSHLFAESGAAPPTSMAVEEAAAALLKLAPQIATGNFATLENSKFKMTAAKNYQLPLVMESPSAHSCIEPLKKYILHRSMSKMGMPVAHNSPTMVPPPSSVHSQLSPNNALENGASKHHVNSPPDSMEDDRVKETPCDTIDVIDALLGQYVADKEGLRLIRAKLDDARRQMDNRFSSLYSQNRILQQEIFYLRNKQANASIIGANCPSSQTFCGSPSILTAVSP